MDSLKVPVKDTETGKTVLEEWNPDGKQSDGSQYFKPVKMVADDHEHYFERHPVHNRMVICECGHGGLVFPHNARLKDGHVYDLEGNLVV